MKRIYKIMVMVVTCMFLTTCKKDNVIIPPEIKMGDVEVTSSTALIEGEYVYEGILKNFYVVYGVEAELSDGESVMMEVDDRKLTAFLENLHKNTRYHYRIECRNKYSYMQSETKSFTTENEIEAELPTVTTSDVTNVGETTATSGGNVTDDGGAALSARGVCWSTSQNPTTNDSHTTDGTGTGSFTSNLTGLTANTTYYVRAYATNEKGTSYGEEKSFTTEVYAYVDLGLSVKWATCNVGANSPEEYGDYFAWGETEPAPNNNYTEDNCSTYGLSIFQLQSQGYIDVYGNLSPSHDAATANWGGSWRMPTRAEYSELLNNCTWTLTTQNGVNGYKVTSKTNGNYIFLPAAGWRDGSSHDNAGEYGNYWSSTPYESNTNSSYTLLFFNTGIHGVTWVGRYYGSSVRPVSE